MSREELGNQVSSGGLKGFRMFVQNAYFAIDPQYSEKTGSDVVFMHFEGPTDLEEHPLLSKDGFHPKWAMDPDFMTLDGGKTVQSQSGKKSKVGKAYGRMCKAATDATAHLANTPNDPLNNVSATAAAGWTGHTWIFDEVEFDWGKEIGTRTELHPTVYVGAGDVTKAAGVAAAPVAAPWAAAPVAAPAPVAETSDALLDAVKGLAVQSADFNSFKQQALGLAGVTDRTDLLIAISDANQGIWAQLNPTG